jgi:hypothetical protein
MTRCSLSVVGDIKDIDAANVAAKSTDHILTNGVENRSFPKRSIFEDGTQLDEEKEVA